ncbi:MAG TPA: G1 family glutamic endopeptidase [Ktedonobacterales bacterium]|nr:G1 family glutamic endopeptidase [Ktedonobacterales bacterium]
MRKVYRIGLSLVPIPLVAAALIAAIALGVGGPGSAAAHAATQAPSHHTAPRIRLHGGTNSNSTNWSGYANTGTTFTDVKGSWTEPTATCSSGQTAYSSFWVGIDGDTTNTVEQTGTDADCSSGTPTYYAWYEMYPKFPVNLSNPVAPGDALSAEVSTNGHGGFTLTISDSKQGWTFTTNQTSKKARLGSAEWIAEAPSGSGGVLPLANFGTVSFSNCSANGKSISSNPNADEIVMVTSSGTVKAQPSALNSGGNGFSVAWKHS